MDRDEELVDDSELCVKASDDGLVYHVRDIPHPQVRIDQLQVEEVWQRVDATGGRLLGRGGFGQVFKEQCMHDIRGTKVGRFRAVKVIERGNEVTKAYYREELKALAKFSNPKYHSWFVKCLGWYEAMDRIFITMEYLEHGDLQRYLSRQFSELESHRITSQVVKGLGFMHRYNFIHRDLKPANLLVVDKPPEKDWWVKISDFGISKRSTDGQQEYSTVNIGTQEYMAPEVRFFKRKHKDDKAAYTVAADMWALGELCVRLITGNPAFDLRELVEYYHYQQAFVPDDALVSLGVSQDARDFIRAVMAPDPQDRLSADEATKHCWITLNHRPTPPVYGPVNPLAKPSNASDPGLTDQYRATAQWDSGVFDVEQPAQDVTMRPVATVRQASSPAMSRRNPDAMPGPATQHPSNTGTQATEYVGRNPTAATQLGKPRSSHPVLSPEETRRSGHIAGLDPFSTLSTDLALRNAELAQPPSDPNGPRKDVPQRPMANGSNAPSGLRAKFASFLGLPGPDPIPSTPAGIPGVSPSRFNPRRPPPPPPPRATKPANYTPPPAASPAPREPYLPNSKPLTTAPGPTVSANHQAGPQVSIPNIRLSFITAQDQAKFENLFKSAVEDGQATMSGELAKDILIRSRLDTDSLYHVWRLADSTRSGQLYFPEFCLAMYLCNLKLTGRSLPSTLPDNIKNEVSSMVDMINFSVPEEPEPSLATTPRAPTPPVFIHPLSLRGRLEAQSAMPPRSLSPGSGDIRLSQESLAAATARRASQKNQQMLDELVGNKERETERPQTRRVLGYDQDGEKQRGRDKVQNTADAHARQRSELEAQQKKSILNAGPQRGARTKEDAEKDALEQRLHEAQEIDRRQRELFRNSGPQKGDRKARVTLEEAAEQKRQRDALQEEERQQALLRNSDPETAQAQRQREAEEIERRQRELFLNSGPQKKRKAPRSQPTAAPTRVFSQYSAQGRTQDQNSRRPARSAEVFYYSNLPEYLERATGDWDGRTRKYTNPQTPYYS